ncbi:uncharacterized protein FTOL_12341 [Fusarium torulosum]|uniref:Uncharacterized protein n=1 Tax=Fusarium torulosum TaxID=33205 RepID=A0AAE8MKB5_9HYPO|nr:uncharacterized protein FTOL_12341 [Fusarium torulosum]
MAVVARAWQYTLP